MKKRFLLPISILSLFLNSIRAQTYDICVYGGTSAGVIAAYTAAKAGKTVTPH
jgi:NADPH-dependent 2,4-dienoyl-CoA reductase/sulfur reductase-like enzyme